MRSYSISESPAESSNREQKRGPRRPSRCASGAIRQSRKWPRRAERLWSHSTNSRSATPQGPVRRELHLRESVFHSIHISVDQESVWFGLQSASLPNTHRWPPPSRLLIH